MLTTSYSKLWQKASLLALGITSVFWGVQVARAADCVLLPQTAYKSKESPAVFYVTRSCTKRPFTNETAFFAYFSSWKQVKITSATNLKNIPDDVKGPMSYKDPNAPATSIVTPTIPTVPATPVTPPVSIPVIETPVIPVPSTPVSPSIPTTPVISTPTISQVMSNFLRCPSDSERASLDADFNVVWGKDWTDKPFACDYNTTSASRLPIYATLRLLKDLQFSKPLPFTGGKNLYAYLTAQKLTLNPGQNCAEYSTGWNLVINLGGTFAHTHAVKSGSATCEASGASRTETLDGFVYNPIYKAGTFVHEAHHAINGSTHTGVNGGDKNINENSAWAAQFYFYAWLNLYSDVDDTTKILAKNAARDIVLNRFSENKCPSDTELKAVVNKMAGDICK